METTQAKSNTPSIKPLHVLVVGKIIRVRRYEQNTYTTIICPAKDEYSRPSVVEVRSKSRFGEVDDKTQIVAELGGYEGKPYMAVDKESGEQKRLIPVNIFLDLVGEKD